jgi:hypothetical protein
VPPPIALDSPFPFLPSSTISLGTASKKRAESPKNVFACVLWKCQPWRRCFVVGGSRPSPSGYSPWRAAALTTSPSTPTSHPAQGQLGALRQRQAAALRVAFRPRAVRRQALFHLRAGSRRAAELRRPPAARLRTAVPQAQAARLRTVGPSLVVRRQRTADRRMPAPAERPWSCAAASVRRSARSPPGRSPWSARRSSQRRRALARFAYRGVSPAEKRKEWMRDAS